MEYTEPDGNVSFETVWKSHDCRFSHFTVVQNSLAHTKTVTN